MPFMLFINDVTVWKLELVDLLPIVLTRSRSFVASVTNISLLPLNCVLMGKAFIPNVR